MYYLIPVIDQDILFEDENLKYILKREIVIKKRRSKNRYNLLYKILYAYTKEWINRTQ